MVTNTLPVQSLLQITLPYAKKSYSTYSGLYAYAKDLNQQDLASGGVYEDAPLAETTGTSA